MSYQTEEKSYILVDEFFLQYALNIFTACQIHVDCALFHLYEFIKHNYVVRKIMNQLCLTNSYKLGSLSIVNE